MIMQKSLRIASCFTLLAFAAALPGCKRDAAPASGTDASKAPIAALPPDLFASTPPEGARPVAAVKAEPPAGGEVVVEGRIGGRAEPFVKSAAVFVLADSSMKACNELHGDSCTTPWDYCCEPRESLAAKTATIQVVDSAGKPLAVDLQGKNGLEPLARVVIAGRVQQGGDPGALVINAQRIYVEPRGG